MHTVTGTSSRPTVRTVATVNRRPMRSPITANAVSRRTGGTANPPPIAARVTAPDRIIRPSRGAAGSRRAGQDHGPGQGPRREPDRPADDHTDHGERERHQPVGGVAEHGGGLHGS